MKAEGELGYEPSLLVLMEREMDMAKMEVRHTARVPKDRSTLLDGRDFYNPTFDTSCRMSIASTWVASSWGWIHHVRRNTSSRLMLVFRY